MRLIPSQACSNVICRDVQVVSIGVPERQSPTLRRGYFHPASTAFKAQIESIGV